MDYQVLSKLYYKNRTLYQQECELRKSSISSVILPLKIHNHQAFYVNCPQVTSLIYQIYQNLLQLKKNVDILPSIAYDSYARNCLIDEVLLTNNIEGVYSTKKEITDILDSPGKENEKEARLEGLVKKYAMLYLDKNLEVKLTCSQDVRELYDEIVLSEISSDDLPDGVIFRKDSVSVVTVTDKEKHRGIYPPEKNIIDAMDTSLKLLDLPEVPKIIGICLLHYFFGYVHPFYDGNGRLSRFISSYLLRQELDPLVALRLSYSVKNNRKSYYDAFDIVNDEKNCGDTTPFILMFLNIILESEKSLSVKLETGIERLDYYFNQIQKLSNKLPEGYLDILFAFIQNELFGSENFDIKLLSSALKISPATARRRLDDISKSIFSALIRSERDGHKLRYSVDLDELDEYCNNYK